jgi:protein TonB
LHCVTRSPGSGPGVGPNERFGALRVRGAREGVLAAEFVDDSAVTAPRHETWKLIERPGQWGTAPERTPRPATEPPAPAPADSNPKVGEYVYVEELPEAIERPAPDYPAEARRAGVEGTVIVQALVGRDGRVKDARIVKTVPGLDEAAEACVRRWRFKPAMSKGQPVAVWVAIPVKFTLK